MRTYFERITNRHLVQLITLYIAVIGVYTLVPESIETVRHYLSMLAVLLLGAIAVLVFDRMFRA